MQITPQNLAQRLEKEGHKTLDFFRQLTSEQWILQVYSDGAAWTVHDLFVHFFETESSIPRLVRSILEGGSGVPEDFDIDRYNESHVGKLADLAPSELLERFAQQRAETVAFVSGLQQADLERTGRHPFLGVAPVGEMLKLMYLHLQLHLRDIKRVLKDT
jgi:hypothetical protein